MGTVCLSLRIWHQMPPDHRRQRPCASGMVLGVVGLDDGHARLDLVFHNGLLGALLIFSLRKAPHKVPGAPGAFPNLHNQIRMHSHPNENPAYNNQLFYTP